MIYLASPYTHEDPAVMEERFIRVENLTAALLRRGNIVFSPIVHCHALAVKFDLPKDFSFWEKYCLQMLMRATKLYVYTLPDWEKSRGVQSELFFASKHGIDIFQIDDLSGGIQVQRCG